MATTNTEPTVAEMVAALEAKLRGFGIDNMWQEDNGDWMVDGTDALDHTSAEGERFFCEKLGLIPVPHLNIDGEVEAWGVQTLAHAKFQIEGEYQDESRSEAIRLAVEQAAKEAWERRTEEDDGNG